MEIYRKLTDVPAGGFVVAEEIAKGGIRRFIRSSGAAEFFAGCLPGSPYHEVLRYPCRVLVNIDTGGADEELVREAVETAVAEILHGENLTVVVTLLRNSGNPTRAHAVVRLFGLYGEVLVGSGSLARELVRGVVGADMGIYRTNGSLRLPMCPNWRRRDIYVIPEGRTVFDCIGHVDDDCRVVGGIDRVVAAMERYLLGSGGIEAWLNSRVDGVEAMGNGKGRWHLRRVAPGYCPLCSRTHDRDNMVAEIGKDGKAWLKCPRYAVERRGNQGPRAFLLGMYRGE
jgi:hypothetical protein